MAETKIKYVSQANLNYYDQKIKQHVADADSALKTNLEGQLDVVSGALDGEITRAKAAEAENKAAAESAQAHSEALAGKVGTVPEGKTVVGMISDAQTAATYDDSEVRGLISGLDTNKADKTQVATDIAAAVKVEEDARKAAVTEEANRAKGEEARIEGLVTAEAKRAAEAEAELEERIETMEVFWDATEDSDGIINKLKEIQDYIASDESGAATMAGNIQANTDAIAALQEVVGDGGSVEDMIADAVADEAALRVAGDEAAEASAAAALAAAQAAQAAADKAQGEVDDLEGVVATKAAQADLTALAGRVTTAEGEIDTLQTEMDAVEAAAAANDAAIKALQAASATYALKSDLTAETTRAQGEEARIEAKIDAFEPLAQIDIDGLFA